MSAPHVSSTCDRQAKTAAEKLLQELDWLDGSSVGKDLPWEQDRKKRLVLNFLKNRHNAVFEAGRRAGLREAAESPCYMYGELTDANA
jgi:hypothetical protein